MGRQPTISDALSFSPLLEVWEGLNKFIHQITVCLKISVILMCLDCGPFRNDGPLAFEFVLLAWETLLSSFEYFTSASTLKFSLQLVK